MKYSRWWWGCLAATANSDEKHQFFYLPTHPTRICCCFQRLLFQESWVELYFDTSKCSLNRVRRAHITIWVCLEKILSSKLKKSKNTFWKFFEKSLHFFESLLFLWRILKILALFCDSYAHLYFENLKSLKFWLENLQVGHFRRLTAASGVPKNEERLELWNTNQMCA